jgi:hypothetical protein
MGHQCSICRQYCDFEGGWLRGGLTGPWSHWACLDCDDWLDELPRPPLVMPEKKSYLIPDQILQEYLKKAFPPK